MTEEREMYSRWQDRGERGEKGRRVAGRKGKWAQKGWGGGDICKGEW